MAPDKIRIFLEVLAIVILPLAVWIALKTALRVWKVDLRPMLPWLHALRWVAWLSGSALVLASLLCNPNRYFWLFPIGGGLFMCEAGWGLAERWLRHQYPPELLPPEYPGW